jgi:hypothetical protein
MLLAGGALVAACFVSARLLPGRVPRPETAIPAVRAHSVGTASAPQDPQADAWDALSVLIDGAKTIGQDTPNSWLESCVVLKKTCPDTLSMVSTASSEVATHPVHRLESQVGDPFSASTPLEQDSVFFNGTARAQVEFCPQDHSTFCISGGVFPKDSMIGRFAWYPIEDQGENDCQTIQVFDPANDAKKASPETPVAVGVENCKTPSGTTRVDISQFFAIQVTSGNQKSFRSNAGSIFLPGTESRKRWAVVVGFHLIRKEPSSDGTVQWHWNTFWWSRNPNYQPSSVSTGFACTLDHGCPEPVPWGNYVSSSVSTPAPGAYFSPIVNPYVDNSGTQPRNCIVCHRFAMTPIDPNAGGNGSNDCGAQDPSKITPDTLDALVKKYARSGGSDRVSTDMVWAIAIGSKPKSPGSCS